MNQHTEPTDATAVEAVSEAGFERVRADAPDAIYRIGNLRYSRRSLVFPFIFLLGGDFSFVFFEQIFGRMMPLYLKQLHASNTIIGLLTGSIAGLINLVFLPNISMATDRHRGRLGRRIPFLLWATPCTALSLVLIGYAPELSRWLQAAMPMSRMLALGTLTLVLVGCFTVSWHFFNMVLVNFLRLGCHRLHLHSAV